MFNPFKAGKRRQKNKRAEYGSAGIYDPVGKLAGAPRHEKLVYFIRDSVKGCQQDGPNGHFLFIRLKQRNIKQERKSCKFQTVSGFSDDKFGEYVAAEYIYQPLQYGIALGGGFVRRS